MIAPLVLAYFSASDTNFLSPIYLATESGSLGFIPFFTMYSVKEWAASIEPDVIPVAAAPAIGPKNAVVVTPAAKLLDIGAKLVAVT